MRVALPSGASVYLTHDVDEDDQLLFAARGEGVIDMTLDVFRGAVGAIAEVAAVAQQELDRGSGSFDECEMTFGVQFMGGTDVKIVKGEATGSFTVKMHWLRVKGQSCA